ncbi:MAG: hypothetical protein J7L23_00920 [Candidatus Diapherotrites archaeon]|nr:hypothetical protein [Candidatus Diapherotrites archaeon]
MVEYTTIKAEEIKYGTNNFIEVARKEVNGNYFISLSKGYFTPDGQRRYKRGLGFPDEGGIAKSLADSVLKMSEDSGEPVEEISSAKEIKEKAEKKEEKAKEESPETGKETLEIEEEVLEEED